MKHNIQGVTYCYNWLGSYQAERPTLLCLHGFTGSGQTFQPIAPLMADYNLLVLDLIGHGQSDSYCHPYRYQLRSLVADIQQLVQALELGPCALLGYSMGARVALSFALQYPQSVTHLILESGSPGLATSEERQQRRHRDGRLALKLLRDPLVDFVNFWEALPLFDSQKRLSQAAAVRLRQERLAQQPLGLAISLWAMGTGSQANYWPQLSQLGELPLLLVTGAEDLKFQEIATQMQQAVPTFELASIPQAGHAPHLEQPASFALTVTSWLGGRHETN